MLGCKLEVHDELAQLWPILAQDPVQLVLAGVCRSNLRRVQQVRRLLPRSTLCVLFGPDLADAQVRQQVRPEHADAMVVGEPYATVAALLAGAESGSGIQVAGVVLPDGSGEPATGMPRGPVRDLDRIPPGDYAGVQQRVALQLPMHVSRSCPHPRLFSSRRLWELPVRRMSVDRVLSHIRLHVEQHGARQLLFVDQCLNTSTEWLLELCHEMVRQLQGQIRWHGSVWPDPALDRDAVHLLRRSGCRGLFVDLLSGSAAVHQRLATGIDPVQTGLLVRRCHAEGIDARVDLLAGLVGEEDADRVATLSWLDQHAAWLRGVSSLGPCVLRDGAPLRRSPDVHLPADGDGAAWHDGGENNASRRMTWSRELAQWVDCLGLWRNADGPRAFPERSTSRGVVPGPRVLARLQASCREAQAGDAAWRAEHLLDAGILHGREAFCGPTTLELDPEPMGLEAATRVLRQAAALGTREVVLAGPRQMEQGVLEALLTGVRSLEMLSTLRGPASQLPGADGRPQQLRRLSDLLWRVELEAHEPRDLEAVATWVPVLTSHRVDQGLPVPRITLRVRLDREHPELAPVILSAVVSGVDRVRVELATGEQQRLSDEQRQQARDGLVAHLSRAWSWPTQGARLTDPAADSLWPALQDAAFVPGTGWPAGFELLRGEPSGEDRCVVCPAGVASLKIRALVADMDARYGVFDPHRCGPCEHLASCPVDRVDFSVRLPFTWLHRPAQLLGELAQLDSGLGLRSRHVERSPCLVGWDAARVDGAGWLYVCPDCGSDPVGNVLESGLSTLWYGRTLNEFRQMARGAGKALPHVDRTRCGAVCRRLERDAHLVSRMESLDPVHREALASVGAGDRRDAPAD